jgi:hypothetical protein
MEKQIRRLGKRNIEGGEGEGKDESLKNGPSISVFLGFVSGKK